MSKKLIVTGSIVLMLGLWGGSWLCAIFPKGDSPYDFAAATTGFFVFCLGIVIIALGITKQ